MASKFIQTPKIWLAKLVAGNTARDGTGTLVTVAEGGANGSRITRIDMKADDEVSDSVIRFFLYDSVAGVQPWREVLVSELLLATATAKTWNNRNEMVFDDGDSADRAGLVLGNGQQLRAANHLSETIYIAAFGGDY